jgi:hypothetical protein
MHTIIRGPLGVEQGLESNGLDNGKITTGNGCVRASGLSVFSFDVATRLIRTGSRR